VEITFYNTNDGIHFPELGLWLDSSENAQSGEVVFVSHAHSDHISKHSELILSPPTSRLLKLRYLRPRKEHIMEFFQPRNFSHNGIDYRLTLLPAGHVLGSSMLYIEAGNTSILYTGDFKLGSPITSEPCKPQRADFLIIESTFGKPGYNFPDVSVITREITSFCKMTLSENKIPVLFAYSLGKSQDVIKLLSKDGFNIMVHEQIYKTVSVYRRFGVSLPTVEKFSPSKAKDKVLIMPPAAKNFFNEIKKEKIKTALLTGWAVDKDILYRCETDAAFALSNHSDYQELIDFVKIVNPRKIFTVHGFSSEFALDLKNRGYDAEALEESGQKWLPLGKF
jgi:Cft2 family RNA processing exonuclease